MAEETGNTNSAVSIKLNQQLMSISLKSHQPPMILLVNFIRIITHYD